MFKVTIFFSFTLTVVCNGDNRVVGDFDQIVLTQSTPRTAFKLLHNKWPSQISRFGSGLNLSDQAWSSINHYFAFIITSFWPSKNEGENPKNCDNEINEYYDILIEQNLKNSLSERWPDYFSFATEEYAWMDAWITHGTCMATLDDMETPSGYLEKALELIRDYNIGHVLSAIRAVTGKTYRLYRLIEVIRGLLQIDVNFSCISDEEQPDRRQFLSGATICFNKTYSLEACSPAVQPLSPCNPNKLVVIA